MAVVDVKIEFGEPDDKGDDDSVCGSVSSEMTVVVARIELVSAGEALVGDDILLCTLQLIRPR